MTERDKRIVTRMGLSVCCSVVGLLCIAAALPESLVALCILGSWLLFATALTV